MQTITRSNRLAVNAVCIGVLMLGSASSARSQLAPRSEPTQDHMVRALFDTLTKRLSALEIDRAVLIGSGKPADHPDRQAVERQLATLRQFLAELPNQKTTQGYANQEVLGAIEARLAGLVVERRLLAVERPNHPDVQAIAGTEAVLQQRRTELRVLVLGTNSGGTP